MPNHMPLQDYQPNFSNCYHHLHERHPDFEGRLGSSRAMRKFSFHGPPSIRTTSDSSKVSIVAGLIVLVDSLARPDL